jgi:hypothetical protein
MSQHALHENCWKCPHFKRRKAGALEGPNCPCPQDRLGRIITPERVRRAMPPYWQCPTLAKAATGGAR